MKKNHILLVSFSIIALLCISALLPACSCGSDSSDENGGTNGTGETGFKVTGSLKGEAPGAEVRPAATFSPPADSQSPFFDDPDRAPDDSGGGVSETLSPESYIVALKKLTLLGDDSTDDYEVFSAETIDDAYVVDFVTDTTFFDSDTYPDPGTYEGIEIEVFYIEMDIEIYIPRLNYEEDEGTYTFTSDTYTTRGYFDEVDNILPRDVTVFWDDPDDDPDEGEKEYWLDRDPLSASRFSLIPVTGSHPPQAFDLWADDNFWGTQEDPRDPLTIATTEEFSTQYGTEFHFDLAEGTESFTIPEDPEGLYEIVFEFDVENTFTWWEYLYDETTGVDQANADGIFAIGFDQGYRIFFPKVIISTEETSTET